MKKNGKYVGVDEKYIPEDEKYVDNNLNDEIKNDMNTMYRGAKEYVSDKENQKKIKNVAKKGLKIFGGFFIGEIVISIIITIIIIIIVGLGVGFLFSNISNYEKATNTYDFNWKIEEYNGTQDGSDITLLLDEIAIKMKKDPGHQIVVIYDSVKTSDPNEITNLKKQFDNGLENEDLKYEVSLNYDSKGYINKVIITNY